MCSKPHRLQKNKRISLLALGYEILYKIGASGLSYKPNISVAYILRYLKISHMKKDLDVDTKALNNRIKRWTRKYEMKPQSDRFNAFRVSSGGFPIKIEVYALSAKKRVFILIKEATPYKRQKH